MPSAQEHTDKQPLLPHVIAIASGKGGVGKSTVAVNLGITLAKMGARVCIFDADTGLANINILLGLTPKATLEHVLFGAKSIEEIMLDAPFGLKIIPGANGISECVTLHPRQQLRLTRELGRIESEFDYLLLDTAAGIADTTLDFVGSAHQILVVITPEPTSLTDAFSLIKLMHRRRTGAHYQVLVNMCSNVAQAREVYHRFSAAVEKYIGVHTRFLGHLLRDESLRVAVSLQSPVALFPDTDPSARSFLRLADALKQSVENDRPSVGFTHFWQRQFRRQQLVGESAPKKSAPPNAATLKEYLLKLREQLPQLIARPDVPQIELAALLETLNNAYFKRYAQSVQDPVALLDALIAAPERNDQLLRALAERLNPWRREAVPQQPVIEPEPVSAQEEAALLFPPRAAPAHRYDERRFGSQQALLELLQRQGASGKSALELIELLLT